MGTNAWRKNHTVTAGLVRRFTSATPGGKQVTVHHRAKGEYDEGPGGVGWELDYWGPQALAQNVERFLARNESDALALLTNLKSRWPLTDEDRVALGRFVSLHIVRTPAFGEWLRTLGNRTAKEILAEAAVKHDLNEEQLAPYAERLASPRMHAQTLLRQINRVASPLLSMHWSIVEFPEDWLIGCDQPVVLIPWMRPDKITPASAIPPFGVMRTFEGRFTLDPRHALLMTWVESGEELWLAGDRVHASHINASLKAQAVDEWFHRPKAVPPFISAPLLEERVDPISPALFHGYTLQHAASSPRRRAAERSVIKMVEEPAPDEDVRWVQYPRQRAA
jgi:hypothetical protein